MSDPNGIEVFAGRCCRCANASAKVDLGQSQISGPLGGIMVKPVAKHVGRWGVPLKSVDIGGAAEEFLVEQVGLPTHTSAVPPLASMLPGKTNMSEPDLALLRNVVGQSAVSTDPADRATHSVGCSLTDYLRLRGGEEIPTPDAIVRPADKSQVLELLRICGRQRIDVVPFGGGTSVVGGVSTYTGDGRSQIAVAFDNMANVVEISDINCAATVQPGITGPVLERVLDARGFTLGHFPQSWERATIGGYVATRSAGQASSGYGRADEMVESLTVATPQGELTLGRAPKSAAGPDLRQLFIGSEGILGIVTEVTLRIRHKPAHDKYEGLMFPDFESGANAFRQVEQAGFAANVMRLSDESESRTTLKMSGPSGRTKQAFEKYLDLRNVSGGCLAILGWEGNSRRAMSARRTAAWSILRKHGAVSLGSSVGAAWRKHRFEGPYLRDELLDRGYIVETLETASHYSDIPELKSAVERSLLDSLSKPGQGVHVMCHISHVYETGCSLYFTVIAVAEEDAVSQWRGAKQAATEAIMSNSGTVTHHHAVGIDHVTWMSDEIGEQGIRVLQAVKETVDPRGVLNPGKLIPGR
jgi:alkyldihydroxyacetonephosphate synthase